MSRLKNVLTNCLHKLLKRGLFEKTFFPLRITLCSGVFSAFCLYDGVSLQRLRLVSEAFARDGDSSWSETDLQPVCSLWISIFKSLPLVLFPELLSCFIPIVLSPLISSLSLSPWLDSALYLHPRQSIKVLNGGVYLVRNIQHDNKKEDWENKNKPIQSKTFFLVEQKQQNLNYDKINFTNLKYIHYLCTNTSFFFFFNHLHHCV